MPTTAPWRRNTASLGVIRVQLVEALEPEAAGTVEPVVVDLLERGFAVAAVVLVRRERRPLPGGVERLAHEQPLRRQPSRRSRRAPGAASPAGRGRARPRRRDRQRAGARRAAWRSPPTVAASASSVVACATTSTAVPGRQVHGGGARVEHVGSRQARSIAGASIVDVAREQHQRGLHAVGRADRRASRRLRARAGRAARARRDTRCRAVRFERSLGHAQTTGAWVMPAITNDAVRSTGPAGSIVVKRSSSASSIAAISTRASAAPRQKCGPNPSATSWFGSRPTSNCVGVGAELVLVAVGRRVEQHERVAGGDVDAADGRCRAWPCA